MVCTKTNLRSARFKKKYSLVRNLPRYSLVASSDAGVENLLVRIEDSDSVSFSFSEPFTSTPNIVASFIAVDPQALVNVFIETASSTGATIRTSATTTGYISVHAMYIAGAPVPDYSFAPVVIVSSVMGGATVGSPPAVSAPTYLSNPAASTLYTLYVNGSPVPGYVSVPLASLTSYTYLIADVGNLTYVDVTVTNSKGSVTDTSNSVTIT
jgi:hypothetical protein